MPIYVRKHTTKILQSCVLIYIFAPERSDGASYSGSGLSNDFVFVRVSVYENPEIPRMVSAPARKTDTTRVIFQSISKVPNKTAFCEVRNDLGGSPKK